MARGLERNVEKMALTRHVSSTPNKRVQTEMFICFGNTNNSSFLNLPLPVCVDIVPRAQLQLLWTITFINHVPHIYCRPFSINQHKRNSS